MRIYTSSITVGALLKWAGVVGTGGEAKQLITSQRVTVNGQVEIQRGRRLTVGDRVVVQGGPTLVIAKADDAENPPALAPRFS